jgi:hypothetical protein
MTLRILLLLLFSVYYTHYLFNCRCNCICIVFIVDSVSFIVCVALCGVLLCVMCVICVLCLIVVPLSLGKNSFAV